MPLRKLLFSLMAMLTIGLASATSARADVTLLGTCGPDNPTQCSKSLTLSSSGLLSITLINTTTGAGSAATFITADGFNLPAGITVTDPAGPATFTFTTTNSNFEFFANGPFNFPDSEGAGSANFLISAQGATGTGGGNPSGGIRGGCTAGNLAPCTATFSLQLSGVTALNEATVAQSIFASQLIRSRGELGSDTDTIVPSPGTPIPEPTTMLLLGSGLAGVAARIRRRRKSETE